MRPHSRTRVICTTIVVVILSGACTSASKGPDGSPSDEHPSSASSPSGSTPRPATSPGTGPFELTAGQVSIRSPRNGSFRVRGLYPFTPSSCVRPERPTVEGRYPGTLAIRTADDGTLTANLTITFQEYLEGIAEVPPTWPAAALEAQAIAARSYVLSRTGWTGAQGENLDTPICGTSECQVYGGIPTPRPAGIGRWYRAVQDTRGQVLLSGDRPADTVYFSTSNGRTYGNEDVFGSSPLPYLRPVLERDDGASPLSRWRVSLPFGDLATVLRAEGSWPRGVPITSASVDGSAVRLAGGGETRTIDTSTLRDAANTWGPCLLPRRYPSGGFPVTVPSRWFTVSAGPAGLVVDGRGWGHGVGMVQWGAYGKAIHGWSASRILAFYYGGLRPQRYPEPGTMKVVIATGLRSMTVQASRSGATIAGQPVPEGTLRFVGGEEVAVTSLNDRAMTTAAFEEPRVEGGVFRIGPTLRQRLIGRNWHPGCPVSIDDLRHVEVRYWDFHGHERSGPLIVNETVARDVLWVFRQLFEARFPIHRIALPPRYRPPRPEDRFNTRNLTASFNCRPATGNPGSLSHHSYGWAIDINPLLNPYVTSDGSVLRRAVKPYVDRSRRVPGMIHPGDVVVRAFAHIGWEWGGEWMTLKDYMHFSLTGR